MPTSNSEGQVARTKLGIAARIVAFMTACLFAALLVCGCGGYSNDGAGETVEIVELDAQAAERCAHEFNVAVSASIVLPPGWAYNYGAKVNLLGDPVSKDCTVTVLSQDAGLVKRFDRTNGTWSESSAFSSQVDTTAILRNGRILPGGHVEYVGSDRQPVVEREDTVLNLAESAPPLEPTYGDTGNGCGAISLWPATDAGLTNIEAQGMDCDEVIDSLMIWLSENSEEPAPDGWECEVVRVDEGMAHGEVTCEGHGARMKFDSY